MNLEPTKVYVIRYKEGVLVTRILEVHEAVLVLGEPLELHMVMTAEGKMSTRLVPFLPCKGPVDLSRDTVLAIAEANDEFSALYTQIHSGLILPMMPDVNSRAVRNLIQDGGNGGRS